MGSPCVQGGVEPVALALLYSSTITNPESPMKLFIVHSNHSAKTHVCATATEANQLAWRLTLEGRNAWWWRQTTLQALRSQS